MEWRRRGEAEKMDGGQSVVDSVRPATTTCHHLHLFYPATTLTYYLPAHTHTLPPSLHLYFCTALFAAPFALFGIIIIIIIISSLPFPSIFHNCLIFVFVVCLLSPTTGKCHSCLPAMPGGVRHDLFTYLSCLLSSGQAGIMGHGHGNHSCFSPHLTLTPLSLPSRPIPFFCPHLLPRWFTTPACLPLGPIFVHFVTMPCHTPHYLYPHTQSPYLLPTYYLPFYLPS